MSFVPGLRAFGGSVLLGAVVCATSAWCQVVDKCNANEFRIAVDIGHTPNRPGAISARGQKEYDFNRRLALFLIDSLHAQGFTSAFVVNIEGTGVNLRDRTSVAKVQDSDFFISIHHDSVQPQYLKVWKFQGQEHHYTDHAKGFSLFVSSAHAKTYDRSLRAATTIAQSLKSAGVSPTLHHREAIQGENRRLIDPELGIYDYPQLVVLRTAASPALLFEAGVIANREEEALLSTPGHVAKLADALTAGLKSACGE